MRLQAQLRLEKEAHPERFCPDKRCLWRVIQTRRGVTQYNPCRNHPHLQRPPAASDLEAPHA